MGAFRYFFRRRRSLRCIIFLFAVVFVRLFFISSLNVIHFERPSSQYDKSSSLQGNASKNVCLNPRNLNNAKHADVYTYDLPDITDYSFVTGKRFKEYKIPVKSEQEAAYGPHLDTVTVLLIPFSHVDPGYGKTMERYYQDQTKHTLNHLVDKLDQYRDLTFQWVETVFLERWWRDINEEKKQKVRDQVQRGQLEIVLGGWVMPDEASTHYVSVIDQFVEGHQWVVENLGVKPKNSWSNDPFGFSSTMPYLWKKSGMDNMVILRIHQAIKATLMKKKTMEFNWKPLWSESDADDILCHLMPYRGYWIGDVCGPYNQHICREYAFMRENPIDKVVFLTDANLEERARILYEQYRITAEIYRRHDSSANTELILPMYLGEDFSYTNARHFDLIFQSYDKLMKFINGKKEWKMKFKFGTTNEYFSLLRQYQDKKSGLEGGRFPTLAGDFFPYSDYQNDYWTGYYTTRPFNKQFGREIQSLIKLADTLHSYAYAHSRSDRFDYVRFHDISEGLRGARRELGMFLHHDGITGTSVQPVITDFQSRLHRAYTAAKSAISSAISVLLSGGQLKDEADFKPTTTRETPTSQSTLQTLSLSSSGSKLFVMNSVGRHKRDVITIKTDSSAVSVLDEQNKQVITQVTKDTNGVLVSFEAAAPALGIHSYTIKPLTGAPTALSEESNEISSIENDFLELDFDAETGHLSKITDKKTNTVASMKTAILAYTSLRSGAYIFAPTGEASEILKEKPELVVRKGKVYSEVQVHHTGFRILYRLNNGNGINARGVIIKTEINMREMNPNTNREVVLRFDTSISSGNTFYSDQNGFQLLGRKNFPDRPVEQNFYPLTSMAVIEDTTRRLTLHAGQPHGFASLKSGSMEIMLDRKVSRDDDKGLGQGIGDNIPTHADFVLQLEPRQHSGLPDEVKYTYPSQNALLMSEIITDPLYTVFLKDSTSEFSKALKPAFSPMKGDLPCGVSIVGFRTLVKSDLQYNGTSVILHRKPSVCGLQSDYECSSEVVNFESLLPKLKVKSGVETTLTHLHNIGDLQFNADMSPNPNELRAFKIIF